jgi:hypothetical protein
MPHPKAQYLPGDTPPDLPGQVDKRIRSCLDGSHLPNPHDLVGMLVTALRAEVPVALPANPAALTNDTEVFQETARSLLGTPGALNADLGLFPANLQAHAMAAISQQDPIYGAYTPAQAVTLLQPFLDRIAQQLVVDWYQQSALRVRPSGDIVTLFHRFATLAALGATGPQDVIGAAYLAAHPQSPTFRPVLPQQFKEALTEGLGRPESVRTALQGASTVAMRNAVDARWSTNPLVEAAASELDDEKTSLVTEKALPETVKNIKAALHALTNIVDPGAHAGMPRPRFTVVKAAGRDQNIRASTEAGGVNVTIGQFDGPDVVAHEVGHVLENVLPLGCWLDLMRLLKGRHAVAGGGDTLLPLHPGTTDTKLAKECAYRSVMPAYPARGDDRGSYAARVYGGDSPTEVMSTALEMLVVPKNAKSLLFDDPQVLAIVLRWLTGPGGVAGNAQLLTMALPTAM